MPSPHARGYSLELNYILELLYDKSKNGNVNSNDTFNISSVIITKTSPCNEHPPYTPLLYSTRNIIKKDIRRRLHK